MARNNKSRTRENAKPLDELRPSLMALNKNRFRLGFTPDDVQRLEQRSRTRLRARTELTITGTVTNYDARGKKEQ